MTLLSAYIELFIPGEKSGANVRGGKCPDTDADEDLAHGPLLVNQVPGTTFMELAK